MTRTIRAIIAAALAAVGVGGTSVADDAPKAGKAIPPGTPLALTISGTARYAFDPGPLTPEHYKKLLDDAAAVGKKPAFGDKLPTPPAVDLTVAVTNTSDKAVTLWKAGDPVVLTLTLSGKGAVNLAPPMAMTLEFRTPVETTLDAGKSHAFTVKTLRSGMRGITQSSYWTAPGEYDLTATLKTGMRPAPKGAKDFDGFGVVTVTSPAFKITVTDKK